MSHFDKAFDFTIQYEGGYVNDPDDPGWATKYGIAKRFHPNVNIKALTIEQAKAIYKREYWDAINLEAINGQVSMAVFDTAVNIGTFKAVQLLQKSINDVSTSAKEPQLSLLEDGILGPRTIAAVNAADPSSLLIKYLLRRQQYYRLKVQQNPRKQKYFKGWTNRTLALRDKLLWGLKT